MDDARYGQKIDENGPCKFFAWELGNFCGKSGCGVGFTVLQWIGCRKFGFVEREEEWVAEAAGVLFGE